MTEDEDEDETIRHCRQDFPEQQHGLRSVNYSSFVSSSRLISPTTNR
jgi:hypothetical protein